MFICAPCLIRHYKNALSISQSYGPCESCRKSRVCSDIPSMALEPRATRPKPKNTKGARHATH